jgi:hypothetical protein
MPTARYQLAAVPVTIAGDAGVLAVGGVGIATLATGEFYNPTTNSWSTVTPMPTARGLLAAVPATIGGDAGVLALGGQATNSPLTTAEFYNPITNSWSTIASMPTARWGLAGGP